jgi:hypothetical protein
MSLQLVAATNGALVNETPPGFLELLRIVDDRQAQVLLAINGLRERHHEAMQNMTSLTGRIQVDLQRLAGDVQSIRGDIDEHIRAPGHQATLDALTKINVRLAFWAGGGTILGAVIGTVLSVLVAHLSR